MELSHEGGEAGTTWRAIDRVFSKHHEVAVAAGSQPRVDEGRDDLTPGTKPALRRLPRLLRLGLHLHARFEECMEGAKVDFDPQVGSTNDRDQVATIGQVICDVPAADLGVESGGDASTG